jgi:hypothetical protein
MAGMSAEVTVVAMLRPGKPQPSAGPGVTLGPTYDCRGPPVPRGSGYVPNVFRWSEYVGRVGLEPTTGGL